MLNDPFLNLSGTMGTEQTGISADYLLRDGDVLHFLNREWKVMATPGHTAGSVCYYLPEEEVLFACDLAGGSPFRTAAVLCTSHPAWAVVAGINTSAYSELSFNLELPAHELAELACSVARETILMYPPKE